jgi:HlyD family secretion protein
VQPRSKRLLSLAVVAVIVVAAGAAWHWWGLLRPPTEDAVTGMVRTTEIRIAPEISGRLARFLVEPGGAVQRGQVVAVLNNPELWAAVGVARAQVDRARSDRDRVYAGVREEQVQGLQREVVKAQAVHTQAVQELNRMSVLAVRSDASQQALDQAKAEAARSDADISVAQARYAEAQNGPTAEERALADATLAAAEAARDVVEARAAKMLLRAPVTGTIAIEVAEPGEAVVPGEPILTMVPEHGIWFGFNLREGLVLYQIEFNDEIWLGCDLREDRLRDRTIGAVVPVHFADNATTVDAKLVELRNLGEFAVWRAARATGDHDFNTFFLRLDPVGVTPDLTPGQTLWLAR